MGAEKGNVETHVRRRRPQHSAKRPLWKDTILERKRVARRATGDKKVSFRVTVIVTKFKYLKPRKRNPPLARNGKPRLVYKITKVKLKRRRRVAKIGLATAKGKDIGKARKKKEKKKKK